MDDAGFSSDLRRLWTSLVHAALSTPQRAFTTTITIVIAMGIMTGILASAYHDARERASADEFREGEIDASLGRHGQALEHYRAALALDRDKPAYRRAVALTLLSLRQPIEAERHLAELLTHDPVDGEATLLLARLAASRGAFIDTEALYQRAIYGRWERDPAARRLAARFELIEWLDQVGARARARAELLRVQAEMPDVPFLQRELARRFVALDEPTQAAAILRRELERRPTDPSVAAELASVELSAGRFVEARDAARRALAVDPADRATRDRLTQATDVLSLDPTRPGISGTERLRRSQRLLRRVRDDLEACVGGVPATSALPAELAPALATAEALLDDERAIGPPSTVQKSAAQKRDDGTENQTAAAPVTATVDARADARLSVAQRLWTARVARCGQADGALAWIFDRLSR